MKKIAILFLLFSSCQSQKNEISPSQNDQILLIPNNLRLIETKNLKIQSSSNNDYEKLILECISDKNIRKIIYSQIGLQNNGDFDIQLNDLFKEKINGKENVGLWLLNKFPEMKNEIQNESNLTKLSLSMPFLYSKWNWMNEVPVLANALELNDRIDSETFAIDIRKNKYYISSQKSPNLPVLVLKKTEITPEQYKNNKNKLASARLMGNKINGALQKIDYIRIININSIESWLRGKPELSFEVVVYNDSFGAAFNAASVMDCPSRGISEVGYPANLPLFNYFFEENHGPDYFIQAMEIDDTGSQLKITAGVTVGKKDAVSGAANFEFTYKDQDERLPSRLIHYSANLPETIQDGIAVYRVNQ